MTMDIKELMEQFRSLGGEVAKKQEEFAKRTFEATAGGGMVTAVVNGKHQVLSISIDPSIVSREDKQMLEDLIAAAVNEGIRKANEAAQETLAGMMGGLGGLKNILGQ